MRFGQVGVPVAEFRWGAQRAADPAGPCPNEYPALVPSVYVVMCVYACAARCASGRSGVVSRAWMWMGRSPLHVHAREAGLMLSIAPARLHCDWDWIGIGLRLGLALGIATSMSARRMAERC